MVTWHFFQDDTQIMHLCEIKSYLSKILVKMNFVEKWNAYNVLCTVENDKIVCNLELQNGYFLYWIFKDLMQRKKKKSFSFYIDNILIKTSSI